MKKNAAVDPKSLAVKGVAILEPAAGASVRAPFRVALHAAGPNVSNTALSEPGSGHFRVRVKLESGREEVIALTNGFTEVWLRHGAGQGVVDIRAGQLPRAELGTYRLT